MKPTFVTRTAAAAASLVVVNRAARLIALYVHSDKASAQFIQLHDAKTLPADTAVPVLSQIVAADSNMTPIHLPESGIPCANGIVISNSSTLATKTIGSADCFITAVWAEM